MMGRRKTNNVKSADEAEDVSFSRHKDLKFKKIVRRFSFQPRDNFTENWINRQNFFERRNGKESTKIQSTTTTSTGQQKMEQEDENTADIVSLEAFAQVCVPFQNTPETLIDCMVATDCEHLAATHYQCLANRAQKNSSKGCQSLRHLNASITPDCNSKAFSCKVPTKENFFVNEEPALTVVSSGRYSHLRWIDNMQARNSIIAALTVFYAMVITIFALVFELSHLLANENRRSVNKKDLMFGMFMYGASIVFLLYCYIVLLLNPKWKVNLEKAKTFVVLKKISDNSLYPVSTASPSEQDLTTSSAARKVSHDSPSAGSLFLRIGCVVFGIVGVVYYSFSIFLCSSDLRCHRASILLDVFAIVFVFAQMHFVYCNYKLSITGSQTIARFGTMHLVAANLWTWIRYILLEEKIMDEEIKEVFAKVTREGTVPISFLRGNQSNESTRTHAIQSTACLGAECMLASMSEIMYTSIVEYSLIGAGVMFIVWKNIDSNLDQNRETKEYIKRKHNIRIDCSKTTTGLFFGLAFLAATFTSMSIFSGYTIMGQNQKAATVFGLTDIAQYLLGSLGCCMALWQMRVLRYHSHNQCYNNHNSRALNVVTNADESCPSYGKSGHNRSQELLDMILLAFGMTGEMIYSVAGLLGLRGDWHPLSVVLLIVHITRISQVGLQSSLIYIAGKLRIQGDHRLIQSQPGKQVITFLLLANVSMFLMNLLEAEKAGVSETIINFYGKKSWVFLVRSFSPLTIFYRFHSSVCLAEIWKNAYSWKG